jgi:long-subunit fatty acid transport protein
VIELINLTNEFKCAQVVGHVISIAFALYAITIPAISALGVGMALSNIALIALSVYYIHQNNKVIDDVQKTGYSFTPVRSFIQSTQAIIQNSLSGFKD